MCQWQLPNLSHSMSDLCPKSLCPLEACGWVTQAPHHTTPQAPSTSKPFIIIDRPHCVRHRCRRHRSSLQPATQPPAYTTGRHPLLNSFVIPAAVSATLADRGNSTRVLAPQKLIPSAIERSTDASQAFWSKCALTRNGGHHPRSAQTAAGNHRICYIQ